LGDKEFRDITVAAIETAQAVVNDSGEIDRDTANKFLLKLKEELDGLQELESAEIAGVVAEDEPLDEVGRRVRSCLLYTSPSPRDRTRSRMPSSA